MKRGAGLEVDKQFRVKKVVGRSQSSDRKPINSYKKSVAISKNSRPKSNKKSSPGNRVVVKITSGCKNAVNLINHTKYISRNGKNKIYYKSAGKFEVTKEKSSTIIREFIKENVEITNKSKEHNKTYNMVFSLSNNQFSDNPDLKNHQIDKLRESIESTLSIKYPNNSFAYSVHLDTDNPHVHVILNKKDMQTYKNIDIRKNDLSEIRHIFSKKAIENGFNVLQEIVKDYDNKKPMKKKMKVLNFGTGMYEGNGYKSKSYFIEYLDDNGKINFLWNNNMQDEMIRYSVKKDDLIVMNRSLNKKTGKFTWKIEAVYDNKTSKKVDPISDDALTEIKKNMSIDENKISNKLDQFKTNEFKLTRFGKANYHFNENNSMSYFVGYESNRTNDETIIWGKGLKDAIKKSNAKVGDVVNINKNKDIKSKNYGQWLITIKREAKLENADKDQVSENQPIIDDLPQEQPQKDKKPKSKGFCL